jgi:hypothetical protein
MSFDQQFAPTWNVLREGSKNFTPATATPRGGGDNLTKGKFGEADLRNFNSMFEKNKKANPNDRGYGDQMLARATEQDIKSGTRSTESVRNVFGSSNVGDQAFNSRFETELKGKRVNPGKRIMERDEEPIGWAVGYNSAAFSEVSVYDGIIVDREREDFSKMDDSSGLNYSDYMSGFETITEQLPENHHYYDAANKDVERVYNERLSQLSQIPERGHNMSFSQSEAALNQQKKQQLQDEQMKNREFVLKYRDQYSSGDLLPAPNRGNSYPPQPQQPIHPPVQQQQQNWMGPAQGWNAAQPHNRQRNNQDGVINNRMLDRQLDNLRTTRPY